MRTVCIIQICMYRCRLRIKKEMWEFPGCPVVRTQCIAQDCVQSLVGELKSCKVYGAAKK